MKIGTSPFVCRGAAGFMPEKMGNLQTPRLEYPHLPISTSFSDGRRPLARRHAFAFKYFSSAAAYAANLASLMSGRSPGTGAAKCPCPPQDVGMHQTRCRFVRLQPPATNWRLEHFGASIPGMKILAGVQRLRGLQQRLFNLRFYGRKRGGRLEFA